MMWSWTAGQHNSPVAMRRRVTVLVTACIVVVVLYVISCFPKFLLWSSRPYCQFAQQLAVLVASGLPQDRLPQPPPPPYETTVIGQATVFYIWCGVYQRPFEFRNYLSVRSVLRTLRPDTVWFYYESEPVIDYSLYNTWWQELIDDVPFFHRRSLRDVGGWNACDGRGRPSVDFVYALVTSRGGTFVDESTVVVTRPPDDGVTVAVDIVDKSDFRLRLLKADRGASCSAVSVNGSRRWSPPIVRVLQCSSHSELVDANSSLCVHIAQSLYPKDIWTLDSDVGRLLRREFYGCPDVVRPLPSFDRLAPNIGHLIWVGGGKMNFLFFLCVLSLLHVVKVDVVYVHGDRPPTGTYWDMLIDTRQNVQFVRRENAKQVYGQTVASLAHLSDVWRADIMLKYGGIYADTDAIFVRPLSKSLRAYDVVASYDWPDWDPPFPDIFNLGITVSKPGARFWELCLKSMKWFRDGDWTWNGLRQPYRVMERHPDLVHVEPRLQVICYKGRCHPTWWPRYHDENVNHLSPPKGEQPLDWRKDTFAFHFTYPNPSELLKPQAVLNSDSMYAEMGRMILKAADMVKHFQ